jgi:C_GCAxxG_C_C family probable redox protein
MSSRMDAASESHMKGFNCAQAVFSAFASEAGVTEEDALRVAAGFGGGMGRQQEVCGAVTGALMVIGCRLGSTTADLAAKERTYAQVREFSGEFRRLHGSLLCRDILNCDISTVEGRQQFEEGQLSTNICLGCIRDACRILEESVVNDNQVP